MYQVSLVFSTQQGPIREGKKAALPRAAIRPPPHALARNPPALGKISARGRAGGPRRAASQFLRIAVSLRPGPCLCRRGRPRRCCRAARCLSFYGDALRLLCLQRTASLCCADLARVLCWTTKGRPLRWLCFQDINLQPQHLAKMGRHKVQACWRLCCSRRPMKIQLKNPTSKLGFSYYFSLIVVYILICKQYVCILFHTGRMLILFGYLKLVRNLEI